MDSVRLGRSIRALRRRLGWRQLDLAHRAGMSQQAVSRAERGRAGSVTLDHLAAIARVLDADLDVAIRWRGGHLDRLLDATHAALVRMTAMRLEAAGLSVLPEVSYSEYGERGSIDLFAWREAPPRLLIVEVKGELTAMEGTLRKHDEKVRLAPRIARARLGLDLPWRVDRLLVLADSGAARRRVATESPVLDRLYPVRGRAIGRWLSSSPGTTANGAVLFLPLTPEASGSRTGDSGHRVRAPRARSATLIAGAKRTRSTS